MNAAVIEDKDRPDLGDGFREGERPLQARFCHTSAGDSVSSELAEWRPVPREVQHTLRNAPPGTYELEWYRNQYDDGLPKAWD